MSDEPLALRRHDLVVVEAPVALSVLRVDPAHAEVTHALGQAFGQTWPSFPNEFTDGEARVAWLAPGEWAIFQPIDAIRAEVEAACAGLLHHLSDMSAAHRCWALSGAGSRALLSLGCSLDTHPSVMPPGRCGRTLFAQIPVLLLAAPATFDLVADASFAGHLRAWFDRAALEPDL